MKTVKICSPNRAGRHHTIPEALDKIAPQPEMKKLTCRLLQTRTRWLMSGFAAALLALALQDQRAFGQVDPTVGYIRGTVSFCFPNNPNFPASPNGPVQIFAAQGFSSGTILGTSTTTPPLPPLNPRTSTFPASTIPVNYVLIAEANPNCGCVQSPPQPGGQWVVLCAGSGQAPFAYTLSASMLRPSGDQYLFTPSPPLPVVQGDNVCNPTYDFCECPALVTIRFLDCNGNPQPLAGGFVRGFAGPGPFQALGSIPSGALQKSLLVRGGVTGYTIRVSVQVGNNPYSDQLTYEQDFTLNTTCDVEHIINFRIGRECLPCPNPPCPPCALGEIVGQVNMQTENEHDILGLGRTFMAADSGPFGNFRYDDLNVGFPSQGPFQLDNMMPSAVVNPPVSYRVYGDMFFRTGNRFEYFRTPQTSVPVPCGPTPVDLGTTFVLAPGWVRGQIKLCGPPEPPLNPSPLRFVYRYPDNNGDLIPDFGQFLYGSSRVIGSGTGTILLGSTTSASFGLAHALFDDTPGFVSPNYVGDYELVLGGLKQETTQWQANQLALRLVNGAAPYLDSEITITDNLFPPQTIVAGRAVTNDHNYCFSTVILNFTINSGTFYGPQVTGSGSHIGVDCDNNPANYGVSVNYARGTPPQSGPAANGRVVLFLPQGTYTLNPRFSAIDPVSGAVSDTPLQRINNFVVPCKAIIDGHPDLLVSLDPLPDCSTNDVMVNGTVTGAEPVGQIYYTLNGGLLQTSVAFNPPALPPFSFAIPTTHPNLLQCLNTLTVTAISSANPSKKTSITTQFFFDNTPPVLSGCNDIEVIVPPGQTTATVNYTVTATDNCDGPLPVNCVPPPDSFFPNGQTIVTCTAVDHCGNTNQCQFRITVLSLSNFTFECGMSVATCFSATGTGSGNSCILQANNPAGYVVGIIDTRDPVGNGAPLGTDNPRNWAAPMFHNENGTFANQWRATNLGEVFGIALDGQTPPNIYVAATSVYPGNPNDTFGPAGPGGIYKLSPSISTFISFSSGSGNLPDVGTVSLGNICWDQAHNQLFAADLDNGLIRRVSPVGNVGVELLPAYDHGTMGRPNASPALSSITNTSSFNNLTDAGRRVFGLQVNPVDGRLYYAVWDNGGNQIWSVGLNTDGSFITTAGANGPKLEIPGTVLNSPPQTPITDIAFSQSGKMLLGERGICSPLNFANLNTIAHTARVMEFTRVAGVWTLSTPPIQIGDIGGSHKNSAGGVDYDCNDGKYATGDALKFSGEVIYGVQILPAGVTAVAQSYLIDLNNVTVGIIDKTFIGDVEVYRCCPTCLTITNEQMNCVTNSASNQLYTYNFTITNLFTSEISYLVFHDLPAGVTVTDGTNEVIPLPNAPLQRGQGTTLNVILQDTSGVARSNLCFRVAVHNANFDECCVVSHCIEIPQCCAVFSQEVLSCKTNGSGGINYSFNLQNLSGVPVQYVYFVPIDNCFTINPQMTNFLTTPLDHGQTRPITLTLNVKSACAGRTVCFLMSMHDTNFVECCGVKHCVKLPTCPKVFVITNPTNFTVFAGPTNIAVSAGLLDTNANLRQVNFRLNASQVGVVASPPYSFVLSNVTAGTYFLEAEAVFVGGASSLSDPVFFSVTAPAPAPPRLLDPGLNGSNLRFSMQTEPGVTYHIECSDSLTPPNWQTVETTVGDGGVRTLAYPCTNTQRFYRLRVQ